jgi:hypothetical protein
MATKVGFDNLSKKQRDALLGTLSGDLSRLAIGRKLEIGEPIKSSIEIIPIFISTATAAIDEQISSSNSLTQPGFTGPNSIEFYINVLNALDNMILLDFIRENQPVSTSKTVDYSVTKTADISLDMALVYYSIKYPNDTVVDGPKLTEIKRELNATLFN